jgi:hypothetical protein
MSSRLSRGILSISIDVDSSAGSHGLEARRSFEQGIEHVAGLLARHQLPATWAVADPAVSPIAERIVALGKGHEIAIAGDPTWAGREAGRGRFGRELARRVVQGRGADLAISTLIVHTVDLDDQYDLIVKQGLTAVCQKATSWVDAARKRVAPLTPRFGLWSFGVSCALPGTSRIWRGGGGGRAARTCIDRAVRGPGMVHLAINLPQLVARGHGAQRVLERVLLHVAARQRRGTLEVATLAATAKRLTNQCQSKPSRSILRPAA